MAVDGVGEGMRGEFGHGDSVAPVGVRRRLVVFENIEFLWNYVEFCRICGWRPTPFLISGCHGNTRAGCGSGGRACV